MEIDANAVYLEEFFTGENEKKSSSKIKIPDFQRNYSWDSKHIKELIDSINANEKGYYIGNILIQNSKNGSSSRDLVIDGQQRLTTICLILKSLIILGVSTKNIKKCSDILYCNEKKDLLRIEFIRENLNTSFRKIVSDNNLISEEFMDENSKKFLSNFNIITKYIKTKVDNKNLFFEKITKLIFVIIKFNDQFDVNSLFEGLNSKGKTLSPVQLTKNALIGSSKKEGFNRDKIISIWENIEKSFEKNKIVWFDKFLRHFGFYEYNYVTSKDLFKKIKVTLTKSNTSILDFSTKLEEDALLYIRIRSGKLLKDDLNQKMSECDWVTTDSIIKNLSYAGLDQVYSILFATIKYAKSNSDYLKGKNSRFLKDLKKIWSFSILVKYLDTKPSLYERDFAKYSYSLNMKKSQASQVLFAKIKEIISKSSKEKFISNINQRIRMTGEDDNKITPKNNRNYVSLLILIYLTEGDDYVRDFTIEHIIPKGKTDGLKNWTNIQKEYIDNIKKNSIYQMGNLTLVKKDVLANESFDNKNKYYQIDNFTKNKLINNYSDLFNSPNPSEAVDKRGYDMAAELYDLLSKPLI